MLVHFYVSLNDVLEGSLSLSQPLEVRRLVDAELNELLNRLFSKWSGRGCLACCAVQYYV